MNTSNNILNYDDLLKAVTALVTTEKDKLNFLAWFEWYGCDCWNGEHYVMENGFRLYPILDLSSIKEVEE